MRNVKRSYLQRKVVTTRNISKKTVRESVTEARNVLTELLVNEFRVQTGNRRLSRMNALIERISLADTELGTKIWVLVNAPVLLNTAEGAYKGLRNDPEVEKYMMTLKNGYFKDLEWALKRCAELEKNPLLNS